MIFIDELKYNRIYKNKVAYPLTDDKYKGSAVFLLAPNHASALNILHNERLIHKYYRSYYIEKSAIYYINNEGYIEENYIGGNHTGKDLIIENDYMRITNSDNDIVFAFPNDNVEFVNEATSYNNKLRKVLYNDRFKTPNEVLSIYKTIKKTDPFINKTFLEYDKYKGANLIIDTSYYHENFFKQELFGDIYKQADCYINFLNRIVNDKRLNGLYTQKTILYPIDAWRDNPEWSNPLKLFFKIIKKNPQALQVFKNIDFVLIHENGCVKLNLSELEMSNLNNIKVIINKLDKNAPSDEPEKQNSTKSIVDDIISDIEKNKSIKMNSITKDPNEEKDYIIKAVTKAAVQSKDKEEALENLDADNDEYLKNIITKLSVEEDDVKISATRQKRLDTAYDKTLRKEVNGQTVSQLITTSNTVKEELPSTKLNIDSVNEEWNDLKFINRNKVYDINADIVNILSSFKDKTNPVVLLDVKTEDTSTSEDSIMTYRAQMEDAKGTRFTLTFDVPIIQDGKTMFLRGNEKYISNQFMLIPISKTAEDTVQIVSNYKKIFIRTFGTTTGKSFKDTGRLIKALNKYDGNKIKISYGDNSRVCSKYSNLPIDYIDLASAYNSIETPKFKIYFNIEKMYNDNGDIINKNIDHFPVAVSKNSKNKYISYANMEVPVSTLVASILSAEDEKFKEIYDATRTDAKCTYSRASILSSQIPVIVLLGYYIGLVPALTRADIRFDISEKKEKGRQNIRFADGYINYDDTYEASLLLNGLKECNTEDYSLEVINDKRMWLDFLDIFNTRLLADGLDNFYDLMVDPITKIILQRYKLPDNYIDLLIYANKLLVTNSYIKHTDLASDRFRGNEIIAGYVYNALSNSYGAYNIACKKTSKATMTIKRSAVIDAVLLDPTSSDTSNLNELQIAESLNAVSFKGLSGMNTDRSYGLDKRTYDDSMVNVLGMSTGFAGNVGLTRQATIDSNIEGNRGFIKEPKKDEMSITKTFTVTEALTPFGATRDDPFRTAMTFIQTSKHNMRIKRSMPSLITTGADQALPYMTTDVFSFVTKKDGKVKEKTDTYMILEYKDGTTDYVNLDTKIEKNSNGGFYIGVKLDSDYKEGQTFKANTVIAYDKLSYSEIVGNNDDPAYNLGILAKVAVMNTDAGFEDSTVISEYLSDAMTSDVILEREVNLDKRANVYSIVSKGQYIKEGEPLIIFQNAFEDDDMNLLLKNLNADNDEITDFGRIPITSEVEGYIQDIAIYRTVEKEELSESLRKIVDKYERPITSLKNTLKKNNIESYKSKTRPDYKLDTTGKVKNTYDGVKIVFFMKYEDKMSVGDKLVNYSANKGVVRDIFPKGKEPRSSFRPDEPIDTMVSERSINARMVSSTLIMGIINKGLIELDRHVKEICGVEWKYLNDMDLDE